MTTLTWMIAIGVILYLAAGLVLAAYGASQGGDWRWLTVITWPAVVFGR